MKSTIAMAVAAAGLVCISAAAVADNGLTLNCECRAHSVIGGASDYSRDEAFKKNCIKSGPTTIVIDTFRTIIGEDSSLDRSSMLFGSLRVAKKDAAILLRKIEGQTVNATIQPNSIMARGDRGDWDLMIDRNSGDYSYSEKTHSAQGGKDIDEYEDGVCEEAADVKF